MAIKIDIQQIYWLYEFLQTNCEVVSSLYHSYPRTISFSLTNHMVYERDQFMRVCWHFHQNMRLNIIAWNQTAAHHTSMHATHCAHTLAFICLCICRLHIKFPYLLSNRTQSETRLFEFDIYCTSMECDMKKLHCIAGCRHCFIFMMSARNRRNGKTWTIGDPKRLLNAQCTVFILIYILLCFLDQGKHVWQKDLPFLILICKWTRINQ